MAAARKRDSVLSGFSSSSGRSTPTPAAQRYDHLIGEQKILVKNAQEALGQSLAILKRASSKEEQESACLQVNSQIIRCEELLLRLKIVTTIRNELTCIQQEVLEKRRLGINVSSLHVNQQWLETRLEKLLLSRIRGRPMARGQRPTVLQQTPAMESLSQGETLASRRALLHKRIATHPLREETKSQFELPPLRQKSSTVTESLSDFQSLPLTSHQTMSIPSKSVSVLEPDFDEEEEELNEYCSDGEPSSSCASVPPRKGMVAPATSSKKTMDSNSDEWCSESEANWTNVDAYNKETASQVLSSITASTSNPHPADKTLDDTTSCPTISSASSPNGPLANQESRGARESKSTTPSDGNLQSHSNEELQKIQDLPPLFESPRSEKVFGQSSWNVLVLARFTNFLEETNRNNTQTFQAVQPSSSKMAEFGSLWKEIDMLSQLVKAASKAASAAGHTMPVPPKLSMIGESGHKTVSLFPTDEQPGRRPLTSRHFPRLPDTQDKDYKLVRRVYGKKHHSSQFPQPVGTWCQSMEQTDIPATAVPKSPTSASLPRINTRIMTARKRQRRAIKHDKPDLFDSAAHRSKRIQYLIDSLQKSSIASIRQDAANALGLLAVSNQPVIDTLLMQFESEKEAFVKYEILKALLKLGILTEDLCAALSLLLMHGTVEARLDLIQLIDQQIFVLKKYLSTEEEAGQVQALLKALHQLVCSSDSEEKLSLLVAIILTRVGEGNATCEKILRRALHQQTLEPRTRALVCLIREMGCKDAEVVECALDQMAKSSIWNDRLQSVKLLKEIGSVHLLEQMEGKVLPVLMHCLANEPVKAVRSALGELVCYLGLRERVETDLFKKLESGDEVLRSVAVLSLGTMQCAMIGDKSLIIKSLLECLELDPSLYVRMQVAFALGQLPAKSISPLVMSRLLAKGQGDGPVARKCQEAFEKLSKLCLGEMRVD